jgi:hypothetical protein
MILLKWLEIKRNNKKGDNVMKKQKFIYEIDKDYKEVFADDLISTNINDHARIIFVDTSAKFPSEAETDENGKLILRQYDDDNTFLKKYKTGIILPIERIPELINNLQYTYDNYKKDLENFKKE